MTYQEALDYIHSVTWKGSCLGLSRITELCEKLGNPERSLRFIHVGGTNGKGSTCRMLSCILEKAGYRVGLYTSPFVERFNERIMLNNTDIPDEDLAAVTEYVKQSADTMEDAPTEFELITAIAFEYYRRVNCDYVVLEVGLGGRLDSTNVIEDPVLSIITGIDLDHMAFLGDTTAKIAAEKAGIIKPGCPVLFGEGDDDAEEVIRRTAEERGSTYRRTDFSAIADVTSDLTGTSFTFNSRPVKINLHGLYQTRNTATVLTACDMLRDAGLVIPEEAVDAGLDAARWMARFEILTESPLVIYDGAHNPQGIAGAVENVRHYLTERSADGKVLFLMGVMADKDYDKMIGMLAPLASSVYCVTPPNSRSLPAEGVAAEYESFGVPANAFDTLTDGVNAACEAARAENRPLVCLGSLYMYADVKHAVLRRLGQSSWEESAR
ncbi:MAG: bifunctional folylpolyglutamate synthase/dihydrofolate synthase [Clostridia bacterium]|nr:bifunctional folylpolyglutamate synthase/dihydrofolate synthase [Clostridia bacterium]